MKRAPCPLRMLNRLGKANLAEHKLCQGVKPEKLENYTMPSTAIRNFAYDPLARELWVTFVTGRRYVYFGVPPEKFSAFSNASSRGGFFNREIRDQYAYREVTTDCRFAS